MREPNAMSASRKELEGQAPGHVGAGGGAEVTADLADFPFPWYLARVRSAMWSSWSQRMPGG